MAAEFAFFARFDGTDMTRAPIVNMTIRLPKPAATETFTLFLFRKIAFWTRTRT